MEIVRDAGMVIQVIWSDSVRQFRQAKMRLCGFELDGQERDQLALCRARRTSKDQEYRIAQNEFEVRPSERVHNLRSAKHTGGGEKEGRREEGGRNLPGRRTAPMSHVGLCSYVDRDVGLPSPTGVY